MFETKDSLAKLLCAPPGRVPPDPDIDFIVSMREQHSVIFSEKTDETSLRLDPYDDSIQLALGIDPLLPEAYILPEICVYHDDAITMFRTLFVEKYQPHWQEMMHFLLSACQSSTDESVFFQEVEGYIGRRNFFKDVDRCDALGGDNNLFFIKSIMKEKEILEDIDAFIANMPESTLPKDPSRDNLEPRRPSNIVFKKILRHVMDFCENFEQGNMNYFDDGDDEEVVPKEGYILSPITRTLAAAVMLLEHRFGFAQIDVMEITGISSEVYAQFRNAYSLDVYGRAQIEKDYPGNEE